MRRRERIARIAEALEELARGNYAHRVILPGDDDASSMAASLNALADRIQSERQTAAACDASRRQLLADISHDLRTPITSIAGYVDALQRGLGEDPERYLAVLAQKTGELTQLTDDLFYAARIDAGDLDLKRQPLDLAEAVRRSALGFEPQLAALGVRVLLDVPETACIVDGDPSALSRILSNLIANALRHGEGMTRFSLAVTANDDRWYTVRATNDGGRLPDDVEALFERGAAGPSGGTGLGLSIARELTERMGGAVALAREDGGISFTITLPASAS